MKNKLQNGFQLFDKRPGFYLGLMLSLYLLVNNSINATSDWMEASRHGQQPDFMLWEPFVWEYSSAISTLLLLPLLFRWFRFLPFTLSNVKGYLLLNLCASLVFSALHVGLMVALRKFVYLLQGSQYDFGPVWLEFFYEYRKDAWGFVFFMLLFYIYRFIYSRLKGEASLVEQQEQQTQTCPEHLLVKKLDKEFLVKVEDIEWLEAAGNYVNLYSKGRIYPLRSTLSGLIPRLKDKGFTQVHRSYGVNLEQIDSIQNQTSGDGIILLKSGKQLHLSRRYKDSFKQLLQ